MKHLFKFSLCALALTMGANTGFAQSGERLLLYRRGC